MKMSDVIEQFLLQMLADEADIVLKRNELASRFSCAPSQINYVIATRFTNECGYSVESMHVWKAFSPPPPSSSVASVAMSENHNWPTPPPPGCLPGCQERKKVNSPSLYAGSPPC